MLVTKQSSSPPRSPLRGPRRVGEENRGDPRALRSSAERFLEENNLRAGAAKRSRDNDDADFPDTSALVDDPSSPRPHARYPEDCQRTDVLPHISTAASSTRSPSNAGDIHGSTRLEPDVEAGREETSLVNAFVAKGRLRYDLTVPGWSDVPKKDYLPNARFPHVVLMLPEYLGEERGDVFDTKVVYLDRHQREAYKLTVQDGRLYDATGELFDTRSATDKRIGYEKVCCGAAKYVMDPEGSFYASNACEQGVFQHSSFLAGGVVAAAGEIVVHQGEVQMISRFSGHYPAEAIHLNQAADCLISHGIEDFEMQYEV